MLSYELCACLVVVAYLKCVVRMLWTFVVGGSYRIDYLLAVSWLDACHCGCGGRFLLLEMNKINNRIGIKLSLSVQPSYILFVYACFQIKNPEL